MRFTVLLTIETSFSFVPCSVAVITPNAYRERGIVHHVEKSGLFSPPFQLAKSNEKDDALFLAKR
jgi:hypothetical protein